MKERGKIPLGLSEIFMELYFPVIQTLLQEYLSLHFFTVIIRR